jgi:hypothetical protein
LRIVPRHCKQRTGLYAGWEIELCLPGPLPIENILMKLKLMLNNVCQAPNQCLALQFAEAKFVKPNLHKTQCYTLAY